MPVLLTLLVVALLALTPVAAEPEGFVLEDLSWMAGTWQGMSGSTYQEEHWMEPKGGMLLGLHRDVSGNGGAFFEYLRIEQTKDGIFYVASPMGRGTTRFKLLEWSDSDVVFENPEHDYPQRIIYLLDGDELTARIEGSSGGLEKSSEWTWKRVKK